MHPFGLKILNFPGKGPPVGEGDPFKPAAGMDELSLVNYLKGHEEMTSAVFPRDCESVLDKEEQSAYRLQAKFLAKLRAVARAWTEHEYLEKLDHLKRSEEWKTNS